MDRDVFKYCKACHACQKLADFLKNAKKLNYIQSCL